MDRTKVVGSGKWRRPGRRWQHGSMRKIWRIAALATLLVAPGMAFRCAAVELRVSREALQRTLKQQLFSGPEGRYYLKGSATTACFVHAEDPQVSFAVDRIVVRVKTHAKLGTSLRGACLGFSLAPTSEVS